MSKQPPFRVAVWDIETHDLSSPFGPLICASVLHLHEDEMTNFRQDEYVRKKLAEDMADDAALCVALRDFLNSFNLHITYYGKGFDIPHLNSRLALHGEKRLDPTYHYDAIWAFKGWRGLKFKSGKMKHVAEALGLERKPDVDADVWMSARAGRKKAVDEAVARCEADVRITAQIAQYALDNKLLKSIQMYP